MKKEYMVIAVGVLFILAAGVIETMPIVTLALLAVIGAMVKKGELYRE